MKIFFCVCDENIFCVSKYFLCVMKIFFVCDENIFCVWWKYFLCVMKIFFCVWVKYFFCVWWKYFFVCDENIFWRMEYPATRSRDPKNGPGGRPNQNGQKWGPTPKTGFLGVKNRGCAQNTLYFWPFLRAWFYTYGYLRVFIMIFWVFWHVLPNLTPIFFWGYLGIL
jgi:hypothetical protein